MDAINPTLVLPPRYSDDSNRLWRAAIALEWPIERLQRWLVPDELRGREVAIYGESLWAHFVAEQLELVLLEPPLDWLATLDLRWTRREVGFGTLADARQIDFPCFVKPAGEKAFEARVYDSASELPELDKWPEEIETLWSEVVSWDVEYRCFVLNGEVRTASSYWRGEASTQDENGVYISPPDELAAAIEFATHVCAAVSLPRAVVVDVGMISGRGWAVIEANPAFGAGIYGCDAAQVLEVVAACSDRR